VGTSWLTFRTQYEYGDRTGSGLDEELLTEIGEHPEIRHYDVADRTRNRFTAQADIVPNDLWTFSASGGVGKDDFHNSGFGLQDSTFRTFSFGVDYAQPSGWGGGVTYNFERYAGLQKSHEGDSSDAQFNDPLRDWTADSTETVHYFSIYASPPRIGPNTEMRFSYDLSPCRRALPLRDSGGQPIKAPNQLPDVFNKLQAAAPGRATPPVEPAVGECDISLRAVPHLRLRVRSVGRRWNRATELTRDGLRLSPLHGAFVGGRPAGLLVSPPGTLVRHPLAIAGALITTTAAVVFVALLIAALVGLFDNPYAGLIVFVAIPALFILGLLLIPVGMWLERRKLARHPETAHDWPVFDFRQPRVRRFALLLTALTAVNIVIVLVAGYGSLHSMESPGFCGQTCHTPMHPQFTAWQDGEHARIACVNCHVGEGARGFVHAKAAGTRQLAHVITGSFPRPIPPGTHPPVGGYTTTCGRCHQPAKVAGDVIRVKREYAEDEANTETMTILMMHVGRANPSGRSIHWHADPATRIEFASTDSARQTITYVKMTDAKGQVKEYFAPEAGGQARAPISYG
jgi:hypothetical protein